MFFVRLFWGISSLRLVFGMLVIGFLLRFFCFVKFGKGDLYVVILFLYMLIWDEFDDKVVDIVCVFVVDVVEKVGNGYLGMVMSFVLLVYLLF